MLRSFRTRFLPSLLGLAFSAALAAGCAAATTTPDSPSGRLPVVATTTIVADVVSQVGGDRIALSTLLPAGAEPHSYEAAPKDLVTISEASLIFTNGAGLETFLQPLLDSAGTQVPVVPVSEGIVLLSAPEEVAHADEPEEHDEQAGDPHTWFDPTNVIVWTENIAAALSEADPAGAESYTANARAYVRQLEELDAWIVGQVAQIPPERRVLVTDHASFTYFANRYGFEEAGAVIPGYSTLAEPSAQELAALEDTIRELGVSALFVSEAVNPSLSERVAQDTGIRMVRLYNGSLSGSEGPAPTYLEMMRYNTDQMISALAP